MSGERLPAIALGPVDLFVESNSRAVLDRWACMLAGFPAGGQGATTSVLTIDVAESVASPSGVLPSYDACLDDRQLCRNVSAEVCEERVTRALNRLHLDEQAEYLHLHAGAVARDGQTVLVIGPSHAGKSTLVAKLVTLGWSYLSDEQLGVTTTGALVAYPRPISLRRDSWQLFPDLKAVLDEDAAPIATSRVEVSPTELGSVHKGQPIKPTLVVCPDVSVVEHASNRLTVAATMSMLVADSLDLERSGEAGVDAMLAVVAGAPGYRIEGQDIEVTCAVIEQLCEAAEPPGPALDRDHEVAEVNRPRSWLLADRSAAIYDTNSGVFAVVDEAGYHAWRALAAPAESWPVELATSEFVTELTSAGLLDQ